MQQSLSIFVQTAKKYVPKNKIVNVFEVGARDCVDTLSFRELLPESTIYAFECNPNTLGLCRKNIKNSKNINLIEKAVTNFDGKVTFYPINKDKTVTVWKDGNPGASSLLKASGKYPLEKYEQDEVEVETTKLATFLRQKNISSIDLLWMDIQGSELNALKGLDDKISQVKIVHLEIEFFEIYEKQPLFRDIKSFFKKSGFIFLGFTNIGTYAGDAIFLNQNVVEKNWTRFWLKFTEIFRYLLKSQIQ
ncbi:MAG: FkbM family methyltransferase [bacterium]